MMDSASNHAAVLQSVDGPFIARTIACNCTRQQHFTARELSVASGKERLEQQLSTRSPCGKDASVALVQDVGEGQVRSPVALLKSMLELQQSALLLKVSQADCQIREDCSSPIVMEKVATVGSPVGESIDATKASKVDISGATNSINCLMIPATSTW